MFAPGPGKCFSLALKKDWVKDFSFLFFLFLIFLFLYSCLHLSAHLVLTLNPAPTLGSRDG